MMCNLEIYLCRQSYFNSTTILNLTCNFIGPRRGFGIDHLNRRITDLKVEGSPSHSPNSSPSCTQGKISSQVSSDLSSPRMPNTHLVCDIHFSTESHLIVFNRFTFLYRTFYSCSSKPT